MFKKIGRSLALQFTGFVFLLFLINGAIFLVADLGNGIRRTHDRMLSEMTRIQSQLSDVMDGIGEMPFVAHPERLRIVDEQGMAIFSGELFTGLPMEKEEGFSLWTIGNEEFVVLTSLVAEDGEQRGFVQIAEPEADSMGDLPLRSLLYTIVSILISLLTYVVGKHFAKRSLRPAEEMLVRLEQFTQDASHELRTPLAVLGTSLDLALKTKRYREGILSAKEDLQQTVGLVERLLEIAGAGSVALDRKSINLSTLLKQAVEKFQPLAAASGIAIRQDIDNGIVVEVDETLVNQIVWNLLSNAIKFSSSGGTIAVMLTAKQFAISDTGIGIKPSGLERIFERFYQADSSRAHGGFGLGLSFVKQIIDLHGWTIEAESEIGKGTTFTVFFGTNNHRIS